MWLRCAWTVANEKEVEALDERLQEQNEDAYCYLNEIEIV